ncbi:hypothetical protein [Spirosoma radiotolerans]|uniref:Uncharacterized protein n=1 Tax=Spirosoma radiotolerans TaxID=1379870 RepID=A0A0E3ZTA5_9BACT|nr:hypothetical protein [Spirosoma radiotolerans]AKD53804.1 hypothetical protein SD10_01690 [Spirosoma radiotolerans]
MEQILLHLQSYFHFRGAVLRSLSFQHLSKSEFTRITGLNGNSKYRRRTNPDLWKPAEIYRLARELGLWDGSTKRLDRLAALLNELSDPDKKVIFKACTLTEAKLQVRLLNSDSWQPQELEKLNAWCRQHLASGFKGVHLEIVKANAAPSMQEPSLRQP